MRGDSTTNDPPLFNLPDFECSVARRAGLLVDPIYVRLPLESYSEYATTFLPDALLRGTFLGGTVVALGCSLNAATRAASARASPTTVAGSPEATLRPPHVHHPGIRLHLFLPFEPPTFGDLVDWGFLQAICHRATLADLRMGWDRCGGKQQAIGRCRRRVSKQVLLWTASQMSGCTSDVIESAAQVPSEYQAYGRRNDAGGVALIFETGHGTEHGARWRARWPRDYPD